MSSLRFKLWIGFGGLLAVLLAVSILTVVVLTRYSHALEQVFHENYDSAIYCDGMQGALDRLNMRAQSMIWQPSPELTIDAQVQENQFDDNLALQLGNCTLPGETQHTQELAQDWQQYKTYRLQFDKESTNDREKLYRVSLLPLYQEMKQTATWISSANMANMISVDGQVKRALLEVRNALLVLVTSGTLVAGAVVWAVAAAILRQLKALTNSARQVEAGNLELNVPVRSGDEIGQLAEAFNSMSMRLREFRKLDHQRLVRTQQTTQLAIDSLPDSVFVIGPQGKVEISNRSAEGHFGVRPGLTVAELSLKWLTPLYEEVCRTGNATEPQGYKTAIQLFDGSEERFLLPRALPMVVEGNVVIGVTVILVDVTRLHSADEAKSSLVSTVSHELRTPLTSIRMALGLLTGGRFAALEPKQASLLKAAKEDSERLNRIVENLLNLSRMESGTAQFQLRPMSPAEIISQAVDPLRSAFAEKAIALTIDLPQTLPQVWAEPAAIGSALTNLLSNALKFTPTGGRVCVAAMTTGDFVAVEVSDTGPGVPEQFAGRIFDRFFRVPRNEGPSGAGLGLAIAKEVVIAHGGTIELCHGNGPGSTFRFTLRQVGNTVNERSELASNLNA
jgi:NtrC-family two-component system sensor histidine kinase KinB